jgi:hypothetical protein
MPQYLIAGLLVGVYTLSPQVVRAQETPIAPHSSSTISPTDRFEIVQSHLAAKWTFRLDKMCGFVSQLVKTMDDGAAWESMSIEKLPTCQRDGKTHYQLLSSSLAARHTFLMNTDTGTSWVLVVRKNKEGAESVWALFAE